MRSARVLLVLALFTTALALTSTMVHAEGPRENGKVTLNWKLGQTLSPDQHKVVNDLLAFYKSRGMTYEADMLSRTINGKLTASELQTIQLNGNILLFDSRDAHWAESVNCQWVTWLDRPWWLLGRNEHFAYSTINGGDCEIDRMDMQVRAWTNAGVLQYDNTFGFGPASELYARNPADAPGHSRSDATYRHDWEVYQPIVELAY